VTGCSSTAIVVSGSYNPKAGPAQQTPALHLLDSSIAANTASSKGGGMCATKAAVFMRNVALSENAAALFGGAVSIQDGLLLAQGVAMVSNKAGLGDNR
jgi:hypothetical protein